MSVQPEARDESHLTRDEVVVNLSWDNGHKTIFFSNKLMFELEEKNVLQKFYKSLKLTLNVDCHLRVKLHEIKLIITKWLIELSFQEYCLHGSCLSVSPRRMTFVTVVRALDKLVPGRNHVNTRPDTEINSSRDESHSGTRSHMLTSPKAQVKRRISHVLNLTPI